MYLWEKRCRTKKLCIDWGALVSGAPLLACCVPPTSYHSLFSSFCGFVVGQNYSHLEPIMASVRWRYNVCVLQAHRPQVYSQDPNTLQVFSRKLRPPLQGSLLSLELFILSNYVGKIVLDGVPCQRLGMCGDWWRCLQQFEGEHLYLAVKHKQY